MNGNSSASPEEANATRRPASDPLAGLACTSVLAFAVRTTSAWLQGFEEGEELVRGLVAADWDIWWRGSVECLFRPIQLPRLGAAGSALLSAAVSQPTSVVSVRLPSIASTRWIVAALSGARRAA